MPTQQGQSDTSYDATGARDCVRCDGTGQIRDEMGPDVCPPCDGSGKVSDAAASLARNALPPRPNSCPHVRTAMTTDPSSYTGMVCRDCGAEV